MATTTVVCPECGTASPGRFACTECGALLASLGAAPKPVRPASRRSTRRSTPGGLAADPGDEMNGPAAAATAADEGLDDPAVSAAPANSVVLDLDDEPFDALEPETDRATANAEPRWPTAPAEPPWPAAAAEPQWPTAPAEPQWPTAPAESRWPTAATEPQWPVTPNWPTPTASSPGPAAEDGPAPAAPWLPTPVPAPTPPAAQPAPASAPERGVWPPLGVAAPLPPPPVRTPAGAYLAPSAVLPPLDAPNAAPGHLAGTTSDPPGPAGDRARVASLSETLDSLGITGDVPRRVIGLGAAVAALGFLLPWAEVVIGSGLSGSYWARWGMAGPGHWIVVAALAALAVLGLARAGRLTELPLGMPAVGLGALLVGLVWPYLFGVIGHALGVWLVLVGAIILAVGGLLDLRRHATATPDV